MRFRVAHVTRYQYSGAAFLEPHTFRLLPRGGGSQRVFNYELILDPNPAGLTETLDAENNAVHFAWWENQTSSLAVNSSFEVETLRFNPYDFLLSDLSLATLPVAYPENVQPTLAPYTVRQNPDRSVYEFAKHIAQSVDWQTIPFLASLNRKLHTHVEHLVREEGAPQLPAETLATRTGACRDVAVVFIEACRAMGIAARFVSGYELLAASSDRAFMHAWAEVFLPGAGWRGYDPSRGLAVAENHVAVAAALLPASATPIAGTFRGNAVISSMTFEIQVAQAF